MSQSHEGEFRLDSVSEKNNEQTSENHWLSLRREWRCMYIQYVLDCRRTHTCKEKKVRN